MWLDGALGGQETVAFAWVAILAFVRLATHRAVFAQPLTTDEATTVVRHWLSRPTAAVVDPTPRHLEVVAQLLTVTGTAGNLVNDAHLAALAIEHGCEVVSYDADFARFPAVRWKPPAATS